MKISYAQNNEDIYLYRCLKNIKKGFYVDIGANDPTLDSVTKLFYDIGWNGINIEPEKKYYELLKKDRIRDINLKLCVSDKKKKIEFYYSSIRGLSSVKKNVVKFKNKKKIQADTISNILNKNAFKKDIHFLKIDVEGHEYNILKGLNFRIFRPWIFVVEKSNLIKTNKNVSNIFFKNGYINFFFDGINDYYVDRNKIKIIPKKFYPINVKDNYINYGDTIAISANKKIKLYIKELQYNSKEKLNFINKIYLQSKIINNQEILLTKLGKDLDYIKNNFSALCKFALKKIINFFKKKIFRLIVLILKINFFFYFLRLILLKVRLGKLYILILHKFVPDKLSKHLNINVFSKEVLKKL